MNVLPLVLGVVAVGGLLVAWRVRWIAPLFLLVGVFATVMAGIALLLRDPPAMFFLGLVAVPYWAAWLFVYTVRGASPR